MFTHVLRNLLFLGVIIVLNTTIFSFYTVPLFSLLLIYSVSILSEISLFVTYQACECTTILYFATKHSLWTWKGWTLGKYGTQVYTTFLHLQSHHYSFQRIVCVRLFILIYAGLPQISWSSRSSEPPWSSALYQDFWSDPLIPSPAIQVLPS